MRRLLLLAVVTVLAGCAQAPRRGEQTPLRPFEVHRPGIDLTVVPARARLLRSAAVEALAAAR